MTRYAQISLAIGIAISSFSVLGAPATADFFRDLQVSELRISPNGRFLAALVPSDGTVNLTIVDRVGKTNHAITRYPLPAKVLLVDWKSDDELIYVSKNIGPGNVQMRALSAIDRSGKYIHLISQYVNSTDGAYFTDVIDMLPDVPGRVLRVRATAGNDYDTVYEESIDNKSSASNKTGIAGGRHCIYVVDHRGSPRACLSTEIDFSRRLNFRNKDESTWTMLKAIDKQKEDVFVPIGFTPDDQALYVLSNLNRDTIALYEFNPTSHAMGEALVEVPGTDLDRGVFGPDRRTLIGVHFSADGGRVYYLDDHVAAIQKSLEASFPKNRVSIVNQSNEGHAIIEVGSDQTPGRYYLYTDATHTLESIGDRAPWIDPAQMATQRPVKINTKDNLALRGYLNLPHGREPNKLPLIVIPSGGPDGHDPGGWTPAAQFLASRGYAVLRLNIRGSSGFGRAFHATGQHQAPAEVRSDVADGVAWAVGEGIADKARVAIFGTNFGGYVALMSMAANPDAFRCGISYGGEVDLEHLFSRRVITANYYTERTSRQLEFWDDVVGNRRESDSLRAQSPLYNAAKIRAPVFLAYSEDDTLMPFSDAKQMRDALKDAGNVEFMSKPNEPHLFENTVNKIELYTRIDVFLQKCNPAD